MNLWKRWIEHTRKKAQAKAEMDKLLYGNSFIVRKWWGFKRVDPRSVSIPVVDTKSGDFIIYS